MGHAAQPASGAHHHAHHFDSAEHEFDTCKQGMWLFLVQEVLFFAPFFVAYFIFRGMNLPTWHAAGHELNWKLGATNTIVLLLSSLTMALCVTSTQTGKIPAAKKYLVLTFILGMVFCGVKYVEYSAKVHHGLFPAGPMIHAIQEHGYVGGMKEIFADTQGKVWNTGEFFKEHPKGTLFFALYFAMTGLHALHVLIGMGIMIWLYKRMNRGEFGPDHFTAVEMTGLYWHFVDLVWIYLFPLLYLVS